MSSPLARSDGHHLDSKQFRVMRGYPCLPGSDESLVATVIPQGTRTVTIRIKRMKIPFRFHPRVFASLGPELVTNDIVAIIELVKNSYDAMAKRVDVRFGEDKKTKMKFIEIEDDGAGMSQAIIRDVWCVVATPYRLEKPVGKRGRMSRRASGEKGLGRLATARIGKRLKLLTKMKTGPCWKVELSWSRLAAARSLRACRVDLERYQGEDALGGTGTRIIISDLDSAWDATRTNELSEQLSRLISPFSEVEDFRIWLKHPGDEEAEPIEIKPPEFLSKPPYSLVGSVDREGNLTAKYRYTPDKVERTAPINEKIWQETADQSNSSAATKATPSCGPFDFEIRAWNIDSDSIENLSKRYKLNRSNIRKDIKNYRGISLYRDQILVLPKSEAARDWLGLDLRRVSRVGIRLSTSQLVGYVAIQAEHNYQIRDTSDRERLEDNRASRDFVALLRQVVGILEDERSKDRQDSKKQDQPFQDLFTSLSAKGLIEDINARVRGGAGASEIVPLVEQFGEQVQETVDKIERRLVYYSRLASLGVLAGMLVHEVRNQTLTIGRLARAVKKLIDAGDLSSKGIQGDLQLAEKGIRSLERLADRLAPLSSRSLTTRRRDSILEDIIRDCISMRENEIDKKKVSVKLPSTETAVSVDPGDLIAVILNLLDNALYWISSVGERGRSIRIRVTNRPEISRVYVQIDDSGPGIRRGDEERIFLPGVTRKPDGLGMGLTVASELVSQYGGRMRLIVPGYLEGASFGFDLPLLGAKK